MLPPVPHIERVRQFLSSGAELVVEIVFDDWDYAHQCELHLGDTQLCLQHPCSSARPLLMSFLVPIRSGSAGAKFVKKRKAIIVRAERSNQRTRHLRALRATIGGCGRGTVSLRVSAADSEVNRTCYVLVSRSGNFSTCEGGGYAWCHSFRAAAGSHVACHIDAPSWVWEELDALITYGVLEGDEAAPAITPGMEQVGVMFSVDLIDDTTADAAHPVEYEFTPEVSTLPTPSLRAACRRYEAAFSPVDGYELSFAYTKTKPRPPQWAVPASHCAPDGLVVDQHFATLTYGEAEFVPLYELLSKVGGLQPGAVMVDLGSGTGRVVLGASLAYPCAHEIRGIELVPDLHSGALEALARLDRFATVIDPAAGGGTDGVSSSSSSSSSGSGSSSSSSSSSSSGSSSRGCDVVGDSAFISVGRTASPPTYLRAPVRLIHGDILGIGWTDADLVFATSLCFPPSLVRLLQSKCKGLKAGARIVCMQASFEDPHSFDDDDDDDEKTEAVPAPVASISGSSPTPWLRRVALRDDGGDPMRPPHQLPTQMSFGDTMFYVYERV
jgi:hypothetical protein